MSHSKKQQNDVAHSVETQGYLDKLHLNAISVAGERFGKLLALFPTKFKSHRQIWWECFCDCGKIVYRMASTLVQNKTFSCGCTRDTFEVKKKKGLSQRIENAPLRRMYSGYKKGSGSRGFDFDITFENFQKLVLLPCHYCGQEPYAEKKSLYDSQKANGFDRVDNKIGYVQGNLVPCCKLCNFMKRSSSLEEFLSHVIKIVNFQGVLNS